jgi:hypothetical protein
MELNFNATGIDISNRFDALPAGDYVVMITDSQERATAAGTGKYLELTLEVQEGPMQGRKLWDRLNLQNPSAKAVEIAQRQLAQICHAVGNMAPKQSAELHYKPLVAIVKVSPDKNDASTLRNEVKGYKAASSQQQAAPLPASAAPRAQAPAPRAAAPAMPWASARA